MHSDLIVGGGAVFFFNFSFVYVCVLLFCFLFRISCDVVVEKWGLSQQFLWATVCSGPSVDFSRTLFHHSLSATYLPSPVSHSSISVNAYQAAVIYSLIVSNLPSDPLISAHLLSRSMKHEFPIESIDQRPFQAKYQQLTCFFLSHSLSLSSRLKVINPFFLLLRQSINFRT